MINPALIITMIIGIIMLVLGGSIITMLSTGGNIGDCNAIDYTGDGTIDDDDKAEKGYKACNSSIATGFNIINIMGLMMIVGAVIGIAKSTGMF